MKHEAKGFSFIELVIVIVLLGIVAAVALPKFAHLTTSAKLGANKGYAGALTSMANMAHSSWVAQEGKTHHVTTVSFENNVALHMNPSGWPDSGTSTASGSHADCVSLWNNTLQHAPKAGDPNTCTEKSAEACYQATWSPTQCVYILSTDMTAPIKITYTYAGTNPAAGSVDTIP